MIYSALMGIRQRLRAIRQLAEICHWQSLLLEAKDAQLEMKDVQLTRQDLKAQKTYLDLAQMVQQALEEDDQETVAEKLEWIIRDVADHVARLEEHIGV